MKRLPCATLIAAALMAAALATAGCGNMLDSGTVNATLTAHQRDSVLAKSALPGAGVVDRALRESDRSAARAASVNASLDSLGR